MQLLEALEKAKEFLIEKGIENIDGGIVLGTGLGRFLDYVEILQTIAYADIPGFAVSTVEFHKGNLIYGKVGAKNLLIMQGRLHAYEGYSMQQITFPIRLMKLMGAQFLFLSNAAGGINLGFKKGDLVLLEDHINLQSTNPLMGENIVSLGPRFPDMCEPYSQRLNELIQQKAAEAKLLIKKGVYAAVNGPNLETKAEYRYLKIIGADLVGMSTVPEVLVANHMQLPCAAISVVTDECNPENLRPVILEEIIEVAAKADKKLSTLFFEIIQSL